MKQQLISKSFYSMFVITMLIFVSGVGVGGALAAILPRSATHLAAQPGYAYGVNPDRLGAFSSSFINFLKPVVFIWICGFFKFAFSGILIAVAYRGAIMGYFIGALTKYTGGLSALATSASVMLPHYLLFIPVLAASVYIAVCHKDKTHKSKKTPYFVYLALFASGCAVAALCDAYITVQFINCLPAKL